MDGGRLAEALVGAHLSAYASSDTWDVYRIVVRKPCSAARYQHVTDPIRREVASRVGGLLWASGEDK